MINACRNETRGVTGLQRAGGRGCAVTIFKRIDRSFLEKLTLEQRFEEVRELHMDILRKDVPVRAEGAARAKGGGGRAGGAPRGEQQETESGRKQILVPGGSWGP